MAEMLTAYKERGTAPVVLRNFTALETLNAPPPDSVRGLGAIGLSVSVPSGVGIGVTPARFVSPSLIASPAFGVSSLSLGGSSLLSTALFSGSGSSAASAQTPTRPASGQ
jgi:hypothetical protein